MIKRQLLTILTAFLFIPAFALGGTSLWTVAFALVIALFFRARLEQIIDGFMPLPEGKARAAYIAKRLPLVVLECALITAAPQIVVLWLAGHGVTLFLSGFSIGVDSAVYGMVFPWGKMAMDAKLFAVSLSSAVLSVVAATWLTWKKSWRVADSFFFLHTHPRDGSFVRITNLYDIIIIPVRIICLLPILYFFVDWDAGVFDCSQWCVGHNPYAHIAFSSFLQTIFFFFFPVIDVVCGRPFSYNDSSCVFEDRGNKTHKTTGASR